MNGDTDSTVGEEAEAMDITIKTVPNAEQRYDTCGDWWFDAAGDLQIRVSAMGDWRYEALVAFHELVEALLCRERGISAEAVDAFCATIEARRAAGAVDESGHDKASPSHREHLFAENLERMLALEWGVDWDEYGAALP